MTYVVWSFCGCLIFYMMCRWVAFKVHPEPGKHRPLTAEEQRVCDDCGITPEQFLGIDEDDDSC